MKLVCIGLIFISSIVCSEFNYEEFGEDWKEEFKTCNGKSQSPINIDTSSAILSSSLLPFNFQNYDKVLPYVFSNNGHTILASQLIHKSAYPIIPRVTGSDFDDTFTLSQFHFHWGVNNTWGSEHLKNGKPFPLEVHFVHKSSDGRLAVLGFLFHIQNDDNKKLAPLLDMIGKDVLINNSAIGALKLSDLFPADFSTNAKYYRYMGSLTTPPCTEGVIWTVFDSTIGISEAQMENFHKNTIKHNDRYMLELNNRKIYASP